MMTQGPRRTVDIFVSSAEWQPLNDIRYLALGSDESRPESHFLLECNGEDRIWAGGNDEYMLAFKTTGPAPSGLGAQSRVVVPVHSRFFPWNHPEDLTLRIDIGQGERTQTMTGLGFDLTLPEPPRRESTWKVDPRSIPGVQVTLDRGAFERACGHASTVPLGARDEAPTAAHIQIRGQHLWLDAPWPDFGATKISIPINEPVPDTCPALIQPRMLAFLAVRTSDPTIVLTLPTEPGQSLAMASSDFDAIITPLDQFESNRRHLEHQLRELLEADIEIDEDGDYPIQTPEGNTVWVRLKTTWSPLAVQVFGIVASNVAQTDEVMAEINLINTSNGFARAMWHNEQVIVAIDLLERDLDSSELRNAIKVVADVVDRFQPLIAAFFGESDDPPQLPGIE